MIAARRIIVWAIAVVTAASLSAGAGVTGWVLNQSPLPPFGGGVVKLIVVPMLLVWIFILGTVYFSERAVIRKDAAHERTE